MTSKKELLGLKVFNAVAFVLMVAANAFANIFRLNGTNTGEVSNEYPNLFTPAVVTFSIWGLIYLLLGLFVLYQFGVFDKKIPVRDDTIQEIGLYFGISSIANAAWVFAWQYHKIFISVILLLVILICVTIISTRLSSKKFTQKEKILIRLPFSVYFGWLTVALIANITAFLVSIHWNGWGISEQAWTVIVMLAGLVIGIAVMLKNKDIAYGLTIVWAYLGILIKHVSPNGFGGQYVWIITTAVVSMIALAMAAVYVYSQKKKKSLKG
jgi:hypothetical protein